MPNQKPRKNPNFNNNDLFFKQLPKKQSAQNKKDAVKRERLYRIMERHKILLEADPSVS